MTDALIENGLETMPLLALVLVLAGRNRAAFRPAWLFAALFLILVHDTLITRLLWQIPWTAREGEWNWIGKLLGLAGTLLLMATPLFGFRRSGLTLRQRNGSWPAWLLMALLCLYFLAQSVLWEKPSDPNSIAFLWMVPGPEEELFYRGLLLLALDQAFTARRPILGADMGWAALLTSVQFGAVHGLSYAKGAVGFDPSYFLHTFALGLAWVWMREKTGSLLAPVLSHSIADGLPRVL